MLERALMPDRRVDGNDLRAAPDPGSVPALEVLVHHALAGEEDLPMAGRNVGVGQMDVALRVAPERDRRARGRLEDLVVANHFEAKAGSNRLVRHG
jgi:hypothetical protein